MTHNCTEEHFKNNSAEELSPPYTIMFNYYNLHPPPEGAIQACSRRGHKFLRHNYQVKHVLIKPCFLVR